MNLKSFGALMKTEFSEYKDFSDEDVAKVIFQQLSTQKIVAIITEKRKTNSRLFEHYLQIFQLHREAQVAELETIIARHKAALASTVLAQQQILNESILTQLRAETIQAELQLQRQLTEAASLFGLSVPGHQRILESELLTNIELKKAAGLKKIDLDAENRTAQLERHHAIEVATHKLDQTKRIGKDIDEIITELQAVDGKNDEFSLMRRYHLTKRYNILLGELDEFTKG